MRLYFDYAASTPVDPRVEKAMHPYFSKEPGNAGSLHRFGQKAITAVDKSREVIAGSIGADFTEIIFTGSATEADNLALRGILSSFREKRSGVVPRIIISSIEHKAVLETAEDLKKNGAEVVLVPVDRRGIVDIQKLRSLLNERTAIVSVMYASNEIGSLEPLPEIAGVVRSFRDKHAAGKFFSYPLLHTDAVQAFQFLDCGVKKTGVDLMTLSAHKIYGPKGIGVLYIGRNIIAGGGIRPILTGGGQEFGLRSGTENVPLIVGFARAVDIAAKMRKKESARLTGLKSYFWLKIKKIFPKAQINGPEDVNEALPSIINIYFPGWPAEDLVSRMDMEGIAASAGSACRVRSAEPSYVVEALGYGAPRARSSVRFSFGRQTTKKSIDLAIQKIRIILEGQ